jgi:uncharacterized protein (DUF305 family)
MRGVKSAGPLGLWRFLGLLLLCVGLAAAAGGLTARWLLAEQQPVAGPVDIGFAQAMSAHHRQAILMSQLLLDGRPTPLARLAQQIASSQLLELGEMQGWLRLWGAPLQPLPLKMDWMLLGRRPPDAALLQYLLDCERAPGGMTGLATPAQLERLRQLEGRDRDRHFLELMLAHHEGGLPMARFAAAEAALPPVRELAARVVLEQSQEIQRMRQTLAAVAAAE